MAYTMDQGFATYDVQDDDFYTTLNAMEPIIAGAGDQDLESCPDTIEPNLTITHLQDFELPLMPNGIDFTLATAGTEVPSLPTIESSVFSNSMNTDMKGSNLQDMGDSTMSWTLPSVRSQWASKDDWTRVRPIIRRLRVDENRKLKDIMAIMEKKHGFRATPKMYKDRIKSWNFGKNFKEVDMAAILRKKTQRDSTGKSSAIQIRGRATNIEEVDRYFQRKRTARDIVCAKYASTSTPPYISCSTPPYNPMIELEVARSPSTPHHLAVPEQLLFYINRYMRVSFEKKFWILDEDGICINVTKSSRRLNTLDCFYDYVSAGLDFAERKSFVEARKTLSKACSLVSSLIKEENPQTMITLLNAILQAINWNLLDIATLLVDYIGKISEILLDVEHPWGQICRLIGRIHPDHFEATLLQSYQCTTNVYIQSLGEFQKPSLESQVSLITYSNKEDFAAEQQLRKLLSQCQEATDSFYPAVSQLLVTLENNLSDQGKYAEAEELAFELLDLSREHENIFGETTGHIKAAKAQYGQGRIDQAETSVWKSVELIAGIWEGSPTWALRQMLELQSYMLHWGSEQLVAELGIVIQRLMVLCKVDEDE